MVTTDLLYPSDKSFPLCHCQMVIYFTLVNCIQENEWNSKSQLEEAMVNEANCTSILCRMDASISLKQGTKATREETTREQGK